MKALHEVDNRHLMFPFPFIEYLFMKTTPLCEIVTPGTRAAQSRIRVKDEATAKRREIYINETVNKYKEVIKHYGGEASARQIAVYLGYSLISMPSTLRKLTLNTNKIQFRTISRIQAKELGIDCGRVKVLKMWSYNKDGIIFPVEIGIGDDNDT